MRKALRLLRDAGLIESVQGRGTFVKESAGDELPAGEGGQPAQVIAYTCTTLAASSIR
ncbi:GntR family transcriptional regulator [Microtetraspora sp. AC03309]|nr:GntR family transcriptional regulator [Microtetraspora sp. AC03309]